MASPYWRRVGQSTYFSFARKVDGQELSKYTENQLSEYRAQNVGFIFQFYNILPTLTVKENVALIQDIAPQAQDAEKVLEQVGLKAHMHQFPNQISGGEQQRVSIARKIPNCYSVMNRQELWIQRREQIF